MLVLAKCYLHKSSIASSSHFPFLSLFAQHEIQKTNTNYWFRKFKRNVFFFLGRGKALKSVNSWKVFKLKGTLFLHCQSSLSILSFDRKWFHFCFFFVISQNHLLSKRNNQIRKTLSKHFENIQVQRPRVVYMCSNARDIIV